MNFDDMTFGKTYKINGYAAVNLLGFKFVNMFAQWEDGKASPEQERFWLSTDDNSVSVISHKPKENGYNFSYRNCVFKTSGNEADFAWLKVDIRNLQTLSILTSLKITL